MHRHFDDKSALQHVHEKRLEGVLSEPHGKELSGLLFGFVDGCRMTAGFLLIASFALDWKTGLITSLALLILLAGRSALLGKERLERLHTMAEQERYEIEHHRGQEREELKALYSTKGFKGELLDKVVDVLMADDNRLLRVMLEEEMGLSLEAYEHPLKQALSVALGGLLSIAICIPLLFVERPWPQVAALTLVAITSGWAAKSEKSPIINALIWQVAVVLLAGMLVYFIS